MKNYRFPISIFLSMLFLFIFIVSSAYAEIIDAREIILQSVETDKIESWISKNRMKLINKRGEIRIREGISINKLQKNRTDYKRLYQFLYPPDIEKTTILTIEYSNKDDDMWIYLPALKKERRLVANNKKDSFMGTDFSYGDVISFKVDDFNHSLLEMKQIDNIEYYVVKSIPKNEEIKKQIGYCERVAWVRKDNFFTTRLVYYDRNGKLLKTQIVSELINIDPSQGKWFAKKREMINHQTGHKTIIYFTDIKTNIKINDYIFSPQYMGRDIDIWVP